MPPGPEVLAVFEHGKLKHGRHLQQVARFAEQVCARAQAQPQMHANLVEERNDALARHTGKGGREVGAPEHLGGGSTLEQCAVRLGQRNVGLRLPGRSVSQAPASPRDSPTRAARNTQPVRRCRACEGMQIAGRLVGLGSPGLQIRISRRARNSLVTGPYKLFSVGPLCAMQLGARICWMHALKSVE
jgi:hypothetical protein